MAAPASAEHRASAFLGTGALALSPFEEQLGAVGSHIAGKRIRVACFDRADFATIAKGNVIAVAFAILRYDTAVLSDDSVCSRIRLFLANPQRLGIKECHTSDRTEYRTETRTETRTVTAREVVYDTVRKRVKKNGRWTWVTQKKARTVITERAVPVEVQVQVPVQVPVYSKCLNYKGIIGSLGALAHEAVHLSGVLNEAITECYALQRTAETALRLGASKEFALEIAADMLGEYDMPSTISGRKAMGYWTEDCRNGGPLDLNPQSSEWPTPAATLG